MGGAKHCSQCQTSHEGPVGRKCLVSQQQVEAPRATAGDPQDQASNILLSEDCINEEQARVAVTQVHNLHSSDSPGTSTGVSSDNQVIIIAELQKICQRFGRLEEQAPMDRQVLSGLVSQFKQHTSTASGSSGSSSVNNSQVQRVNSVKSPKHSKQGIPGSVKGQVESYEEGQQLVVHLTEQQQGLANEGARKKFLQHTQMRSALYNLFLEIIYHFKTVCIMFQLYRARVDSIWCNACRQPATLM